MEDTKKRAKVIVHKSGEISGMGRYTPAPLAALDLSERNMMFPKGAKRKVFFVKEDRCV